MTHLASCDPEEGVGDFALEWGFGAADLAIRDDDLVADDGIRTGVILSLFTDRRAEPGDELPGEPDDLRGWWGDEFAEVEDDQMGSRLWQLDRAKITPEFARRAEEYAREALQWMVDDSVASSVDAEVEFDGGNASALLISIQRPEGPPVNLRFAAAWAAEAAKAPALVPSVIWSSSPAVWAARLEISVGDLKFGMIFDAGALPYKDFVGSSDVDTGFAPDPDFAADWVDRGGGLALGQNIDGTQLLETTDLDPFSPGTGVFTIHYTYRRADPHVTDANRALFGTGENGPGVRCLERISNANNWIFWSLENEVSSTRAVIIQDGPETGVAVDVTVSRTDSTTLEAWASVEGAGEVFHENLTIPASDNYDASTVLQILSVTGLGRCVEGTILKAVLDLSVASSADGHDRYRGATRTVVTEA